MQKSPFLDPSEVSLSSRSSPRLRGPLTRLIVLLVPFDAVGWSATLLNLRDGCLSTVNSSFSDGGRTANDSGSPHASPDRVSPRVRVLLMELRDAKGSTSSFIFQVHLT